MKVKQKVNIRSIAAELNVSPITISRALNGHLSVKATTRKRILAKVQDMGYDFQSKSRTLHKKRLTNVALHCCEEKLHDDFNINFYMQLLYLCINRIKALGLTGHTIDLNTSSGKGIADLADCGSLILLTPLKAEFLLLIKKTYPNLKILSVFSNISGMPVVKPNEFEGGMISAKYIAEREHDHIAVFTDISEECFRERYGGFVSEMHYRRAESRIDLITFTNIDVSQTESDKLKKEVLDAYFKTHATDLPTVFFVPSCYATLYLFNYLKKHAYSIPEDFGIVGYDDMDFYKMIDTPITRAYFQIKELAVRIVDLLGDMLKNNEDLKVTMCIPTYFKDYGSVLAIKEM
ncbi:MAG: LacI family transcriptional regulator [Victivallales bacterium]|nr:LacI family transcriptional regulator [Victivallales bacterium]